METLRSGSLPDGREFEIRAGLLAGGLWEARFVCVPTTKQGAPLMIADTLDELREWADSLDAEQIGGIAEAYYPIV